MPKFKRQAGSVLPDFSEDVAAAVWGTDDELLSSRRTDLGYEGYHPEFPRQPAVAGYDGTPLVPILGSWEVRHTDDPYYRAKVAAGIIEATIANS